MEYIEYKTFEAFKPHFDALKQVAYFRISKQPTLCRELMYKTYMIIVWTSVLTYDLQHIIKAILARHSTAQLVGVLFVLLTTLNALGKQLAFNVKRRRIHLLIQQIEGPYFSAQNVLHMDILKENALIMSRLLKTYHVAIYICAVLWGIYPLANKLMGENVELTAYFPFDTTKSPIFELALAYMTVVIGVQGYANVTLDCTIVSFYAQACTQIRLLRFSLEHLGDLNDDITMKIRQNCAIKRNYKDFGEGHILMQRRLTRCVKHYQQVIWFLEEVQSVFGEALTFQFVVQSWVICMTVYRIVSLALFSAEFISMVAYLGCMLAQLSIFCYYGSEVQIQSALLNQSIYSSDWMNLSPRFRKQLLIMMMSYNRAINLRTAYVIPISLETYISVLKFSYTLYTFLTRK